MNAWQVVDKDGQVVVTADTITAVAKMQRQTPRQVARHTAKNFTNTDAGDDPVFAVAVAR